MYHGDVQDEHQESIEYERLPTVFYRGRSYWAVPGLSILMLVFMGASAVGVVGFRSVGINPIAVFCFVTGPLGVLLTMYNILYSQRRSAACTSTGIVVRYLFRERHIAFSTLRYCQTQEIDGRPAVVAMDHSFEAIHIEPLDGCLFAERERFIEEANERIVVTKVAASSRRH